MKIAAYCRVSTDKEEQIDSLNHQKEFFAEYAQRNGHHLYKLYADEGITGTSLKKREEFKRLMADAGQGLFQMVVVKDISRFARNTVDALQSIRKLKAMGINTLFLTANMDSMGDSEFVLTLFSAMAQEESNNLSKRVKWGKKLNAEKGRVPSKVFGYDRMDNFTLAINMQEARIVRKIFALYNQQGMGCRTISMTLNRDQDKTKYGNDWDGRGVRRVLTNAIYCGVLINHKYEIEDFLTGKQVKLPTEEHFYHERPDWAIISPEVFQKTQEIMNTRRNKYNTGQPFKEARYSAKHIFSTLIKCEHCGRSFTRKTYTYANTRVYWRCVTNDQYTAQKCENTVILEESELIDQLRSYLHTFIQDKEAFADGLLKDIPVMPESEKRKQEGIVQRKKLLQKQIRYQEMYANGLMTMEQLKQKLGEVKQALQVLDAEERSEDAACTMEDYRRQILDFLELKTVTNVDMRRLIQCIRVNKNATVRFLFQKAYI